MNSDSLLKKADAFFKAAQSHQKTFPSANTCKELGTLVRELQSKSSSGVYQEQLQGVTTFGKTLETLESFLAPQVITSAQELKNQFNVCNNALQTLRGQAKLLQVVPQLSKLFGLVSYDYRQALPKPGISTEVGPSSHDIVDPWKGEGYSKPAVDPNALQPWGDKTNDYNTHLTEKPDSSYPHTNAPQEFKQNEESRSFTPNFKPPTPKK